MTPNLGPMAALGASATWAYASTKYARAARDLGPVRVNFARASVAFPVFATILFVTRGEASLHGLTRAGSAWLFLSAVSSYALADSLFFMAARRIGVSTALSIASLYPLFAALYGAIVCGESFGTARAAGTCLAVCGIVALVRLAGAVDPKLGRSEERWSGVALSFVVSVLWALNSISVKRGAEGLGLAQANAVRYAMALCLLAPQLLLGARPRGAPSLRAAVPLLPAIVCDVVLGSVFYVYALGHTDLSVGATLTSLAPLISVPVGIALGEERFSMPRFGAVVATVVGVVLLVSTGGHDRGALSREHPRLLAERRSTTSLPAGPGPRTRPGLVVPHR